MTRQISPAKAIEGTISVPGDKSIAHRAALLSLLAEGPITVINFPDSADCQTSLKAAQQLGVEVEAFSDRLVLRPPDEFALSSDTVVDCGNSGTTARLLSGIIAGSEAEVTLSGDESLQRRPMKRIIDPLTQMGAEIFAEHDRLPMRIRGARLLPFEYRLPVASAQVKSAILLAGLASGCTTVVREDQVTRDHTEIMLQELGEGLEVRHIKPVLVDDPVDPRKRRMEMPEPFKKEVTVSGQARLLGGLVDIPGDISSAAFFFAAAAISGGEVTVENCGLNPTRTGFLDYLKACGCKVKIEDRATVSGEPRGRVTVTGGKLKPRKIQGETTVALIDEIPIVSVIAAYTQGTTIIRDAAELKVKESDRLAAVAQNLDRMGIKCGILDDGLAIEGKIELSGADFRSFGDHRIAMAFTVAALGAVGPSTIDDDTVVDISCPGFFDLLDGIRSE